MTPAEDIVEALLDDGELVDEGGFTIDGAHARAKLRHGLADPDSYVVVLARAALLRGATQIDIEPGWTRTRIRFDGRPLREAELAELSTFRELADDQPGDAASRRALTQALAAALAARPKRATTAKARPRPAVRARILTVSEGRRRGLELDGEATRPLTGGSASADLATTVELQHPRTLARLGEALALATPEHRWARQALIFAEPAAVRLGGQTWPISGPLTLGLGPKSDRFVDLAAVGLRGLAAHRSQHPGGKLAVVVEGIKVATKPLPADLEHIDEAIVRDDDLQLDASGFDVVADARWHAILDRLRDADARWAELPASEPPLRDARLWVVASRELPAEPWAVTGTWPNFVAWMVVWLSPGVAVMDFGATINAILLAVFAIPLMGIVKQIHDQRSFNRNNLGAHLPTGGTLVSALLFVIGTALCLTRLLLDALG